MEVKIVEGIENIDVAKWDGFVRSHPAGNSFQMPGMYRVFESTVNYRPYVVACIAGNGDVKGVMLGVRICNGKGVFCSMTARVIVWGGPLAHDDNPDHISLLIKTFSDLVRKDSVYCEIRNLRSPDEKQKKIFAAHGFKYLPHLNIVVNVENREQDLLRKLEPAKRRNLRKAQKEGLTFGRIMAEEEVDEIYDILKEVYRNAGVPLSDISLFRSLFRYLTGDAACRFYKAEYESQIIGVMVVLAHNDRLYEWYVGAREEFYPKRPNEFLVWNVMNEAANEGLRFFDFGGAGKPDEEYGVRNFKKGFGGEVIETGRFNLVFKKVPWLMGNVAVKLIKMLK